MIFDIAIKLFIALCVGANMIFIIAVVFAVLLGKHKMRVTRDGELRY
jgi:hypothetical protein